MGVLEGISKESFGAILVVQFSVFSLGCVCFVVSYWVFNLFFPSALWFLLEDILSSLHFPLPIQKYFFFYDSNDYMYNQTFKNIAVCGT